MTELFLMTAEEAEKAPAWLGESTNIATDLQGKVEAELFLMTAYEVEKVQLGWASLLIFLLICRVRWRRSCP